MNVLKSIPWVSLLEIGCASGPNLAAIVKAMPGKQVGGVDLSEDAIELAKKTFQGGFFQSNGVSKHHLRHYSR